MPNLVSCGRRLWGRAARVFVGSSELGVGGGVWASCDEEHSESVVGGVAVASGGASAQLDNVR